jgi:GWxTD domain-containing protein
MITKKIYWAALAVYLIAGAAFAAEVTPNRISVLDFEVSGDATPEQGIDVADNIRLMFSGDKGYEVEVYRRMANAASAAWNASLDFSKEKDIVRLGKALEDDAVVYGTIDHSVNGYKVDVVIYDIKGGQVLARDSATGADLRLVTEGLIKSLSGAEGFGVLFPDTTRVVATEDEKSTRWAISLIAAPTELAIYDILSPRGKAMMLDKFWLRRDPDTNTAENEYEAEFNRRVAYAQGHFTTPLKSGIQTDRGKVYVIYGPPDEIEDRSGGSESIRGFEKTTWSSEPYFAWKYYGKKGATGKTGREMLFVFVDEHGDGEYLAFASTEAGYGKRVGGYQEYDANRMGLDEEDTASSDDTNIWIPSSGK